MEERGRGGYSLGLGSWDREARRGDGLTVQAQSGGRETEIF